MRIRALLVALATAMTASAADAAAVEIGSGAVGSPSPGFFTCSTPDPCMLIQDDIAGTPVRVPQGSWVMTSWRVRGATGTVGLQVIEPTGGTSDSLSGNVKASSPDLAGAGGDSLQSQNVRIGVSTGDMIGLGLDAGASVGGIAGDPSTVIFEAPLATPFNTTGSGNVEMLVQATLEPDSDGDGFGDASQDGCPTNGSTQGACPQPPPPPPPPDPLAGLKAGGKPTARLGARRVGAPKGVAAVEIVNPNGYALTGKLTLKRKGRAVGSKRYSIPANGSRKVKVKLSASAWRALKRAGKLKLAASATVKGPIGKTGSLRGTLTVSKKPVRGPSGSGTRFEGRTTNLDVKLSFDVIGGEVRNAVGGINVTCFYPGGQNRSGTEVWDPPGAFPLGRKTEQFADDRPSAILGSNTRKRYTMDATLSGDTVTGTIQVSYAFSAFNPTTGLAQASSCVGEDTFTARRL